MEFYQWRQNVVSALMVLADLEYQRLAWSGAISSSEGTPDEVLITLHTSVAFPHFFVDNREHLSRRQIELCQDLSVAVERHLARLRGKEWQGDADIDRTHADENWQALVELARRTCIALIPGG